MFQGKGVLKISIVFSCTSIKCLKKDLYLRIKIKDGEVTHCGPRLPVPFKKNKYCHCDNSCARRPADKVKEQQQRKAPRSRAESTFTKESEATRVMISSEWEKVACPNRSLSAIEHNAGP